MRSRISERRVVAFLVACLVIETAFLLRHAGLLTFRSEAAGQHGVLAGEVLKAHNQLRRRRADSLVWENSLASEQVYFHDSVLTLSASTAVLRLYEQTEVSLSENTLVTIEPPDGREHGEIRLKFIKGNLAARNPFQPAQITGSEWTVNVRQGSEIEFRQVGDKDLELQVKKGEAVFRSGAGHEDSVRANEVLRIAGLVPAAKLTLDDELRWENAPPERLYVHEESAAIPLRWTGPARALILQSLGRSERVFELDAGSSGKNLEMPLGQHRLYLRDGAKTSAPLNIQVWRAPVAHLLRPLPRDRARAGEQLRFIWTQIPSVKSYVLEAQGGSSRHRVDFDGNEGGIEFTEPDDISWSVRARDSDGFEIPPLYKYPLFIRESPLAPPKLKAPAVRRPARASQGAWWRLDHWLLPVAHAEEPLTEFEADFEWEPVAGADRYVIEICDSADFRTPLVMRTVQQPRFTWRAFKPRVYFWRVAAGGRNARMGVFSEAMEVNLREEGGVVRRVQEALPAEPLAPAREEEPEGQRVAEPVLAVSAKETLVPPSVKRPPEISRFAAWTPAHGSIEARAKNRVRARMSGNAGAAVRLEAPLPAAGERAWRLTLSYLQSEFAPAPAQKFPRQERLIWRDLRVSAIRFKSWWGYGAALNPTTRVRRTGDESIATEPVVAGGPAIAAVWRGAHLDFSAALHAELSKDGLAAGGSNVLRARIWGGFTVGAGAEFESGATTSSWFFGLAGFEF